MTLKRIFLAAATVVALATLAVNAQTPADMLNVLQSAALPPEGGSHTSDP